MDKVYNRNPHPGLNLYGNIFIQLALLYIITSFIYSCTLPQTSDTRFREEIYGPRIEATDDTMPRPVVGTGHEDKITSLSVSNDGKYLASSSSDWTVILWDIIKERQIRRFYGHKAGVTSVDISPDGLYLVSSSDDETIRVWNTMTGREIRRMTPDSTQFIGGIQKTFGGGLVGSPYRKIRAVKFTPDGNQIISTSEIGIISMDWRTGEQLGFYDPKGIAVLLADAKKLEISPDGRYLSIQDFVWEIKSGVCLYSLLKIMKVGLFSEGNYWVNATAFSPDSSRLLSAHEDGNVRLWEVKTGRLLKQYKCHSGPALTVEFSKNGSRFLSGGKDKRLRIWKIDTGEEIQSFKMNDDVIAAKFYLNEDYVLASSYSYTILYSIIDSQMRRFFGGRSSSITASAINHDGSIMVNGMWDGALRLWDRASGRKLHILKNHSKRIKAVNFSQNSKYLVSGSSDKTVRIWDVDKGVEIFRLEGFIESVDDVQFSTEDRYILYGSGDRLELLDWKSNRRVKRFGAIGTHTIGGNIKKARISRYPGGMIIASYYQNYEAGIHIWLKKNGSNKYRFAGTVHGPNDTITSIDFSPDGRSLLCSSHEKYIWIWDVETLERKQKISMTKSVNKALFSPDGRHILVIPEDTVMQLWDVSKEGIILNFSGHESEVLSAQFTPDGKYIISVDRSGIQRVWNVHNGKQVFVYVTTMDYGWLGYTPDGLFDGSSDGWKSVSWRFMADNQNTSEITPVEIFFKELFHPNLLQEIQGGRLPSAPKQIADLDRRQPIVSISVENLNYEDTTDQRMVTVRIGIEEVLANDFYSTGSGVKDLRLFRNGSLVRTWRGDMTYLSTNKEQLTTQIPITSGRNEIVAYGFNRDNIKSEDASYIINGSDKIARKGVAYIIAIGVDQYANSDFNLHYADDDAAIVAATLRESLKQREEYSDVVTVKLLNEKASGSNILNALNQLGPESPAVRSGQPEKVKQLKTAQPEDAVIVFFAGHGAAKGDRYYLLPHDLGYTGKRTQMDTDARDAILKNSISDRDLEIIFEGIDAGQIMLIIDACQSGQALESEEKRRGPMNSRGLAQLAYEKGMYILAAAQSYQAALEFTELGHGLLTHTLIEKGLKQFEADHQPRDNRISAREWFDYAVQRVPAETGQANARYVKSSGRNVPADGLTGREIDFGEETVTLQAPRAYYRRELTNQPWVIAVNP